MAMKCNGAVLDRREQILEAAMHCFAKRGFHQASMHDISAEAGISVGLIYRYFKNKEEVIAAIATEHKKHIADLLERAKQAPTLLEAMEVLFTSHCGERSPQTFPPLWSISLPRRAAIRGSQKSCATWSRAKRTEWQI